MLDSALLLSAEMPDGLGLLLPTVLHGKPTEELLLRVFGPFSQNLSAM